MGKWFWMTLVLGSIAVGWWLHVTRHPLDPMAESDWAEVNDAGE